MKLVQLFLGIDRNCLELQNEDDRKGRYAAFQIFSMLLLFEVHITLGFKSEVFAFILIASENVIFLWEVSLLFFNKE